jgi:hypothetical protein
MVITTNSSIRVNPDVDVSGVRGLFLIIFLAVLLITVIGTPLFLGFNNGAFDAEKRSPHVPEPRGWLVYKGKPKSKLCLAL